jgi:hypothetical protein
VTSFKFYGTPFTTGTFTASVKLCAAALVGISSLTVRLESRCTLRPVRGSLTVPAGLARRLFEAGVVMTPVQILLGLRPAPAGGPLPLPELPSPWHGPYHLRGPGRPAETTLF